MATGSKIENTNIDLKIKRKFFNPFNNKTPKEPVFQTAAFFLILFLFINYCYIKPKTSVTENFITLMNKGNINDMSQLATDCTLYSNKKLNEVIKKEYLKQLSYIIQVNKLNNTNNFYIRLIDNTRFILDLNVDSTYYGNLTKNLIFVKDKEVYKLDTNAYINKVCTGSMKNKTQIENKLLMRQLLYCYQYYLDDYINKGNTDVFRFVKKGSSLYKYVAYLKINNSDLSQNTSSAEFNNIEFNKNSAVIKVYESIRQNKGKIISLKKQNYSFQAINVNNRWLLDDCNIQS
ncbi:MAG: hypothetical protein LIR50_00520 [Bacillota bacterium]|nr:hypothetical protein [Bacillota bacterium]